MQDRKFLNSMAVAFAMMAGLASCSNEELNNQLPKGPLPIKLVSSVGSRAISQDIQSTQIASGVQVGVFVTSQDGSNVMYGNQGLQANGEGGFTAEHDMTFPEDGGSVNIYAYAPYNASWNDLSSNSFEFTVPTEQSTENEYCNADLMIGAPVDNPVTKTESEVPLVFKHMLTKLNLNFNAGDTGVELSNAKVSIVGVKSTTTVDIVNRKIGEATGNEQVINVADFSQEAPLPTNYIASAIFVPQTIDANKTLVKVVVGATTYEAKLDKQVNFESGKKYTYTVKFDKESSGGEITASLIIGTVVDDWEDGNTQLVAEIGDYVTKSGKFVKNADVESYIANGSNTTDPLKAVIFSTTVSDKDKELYNAYAMSLTVVNSKKWMQDATVITGSVLDFASALIDLDGRTKTTEVIESDIYGGYEEQSATFFEYCTRATNKAPVGTIGSDWFVPSIGQIIQILNNLGHANISSSSTVFDKNTGSPIYYQNDEQIQVINAINEYISKAGKTVFLKTEVSSIYATVTEYMGNFWCLQTCPMVNDPDLGSTNFDWGFGKNATKVSGNFRSFIPCVAIKIPTSSASTLQ